MTDFDQVNEVLEVLAEKAIKTSQGSYIRLEDVKAMIQDRKDQAKIDSEEEKVRSKIKTVEQARAAAKRDPELQKFFKGKGSLEPGKAVTASPPAAVEGVKA